MDESGGYAIIGFIIGFAISILSIIIGSYLSK